MRRSNSRCDEIIALIDRCLAESEIRPPHAPSNRRDPAPRADR